MLVAFKKAGFKRGKRNENTIVKNTQGNRSVLRIKATSKSSIQILFLLFTYLLTGDSTFLQVASAHSRHYIDLQYTYKTQSLPSSSSRHYQKPLTCSAGS